ncbi:MAG: helix-turn-helix domain-containing protein [Novosphingobium sp.]
MAKRLRPGVDAAIVSAHGVSRDGQALSYNRAPAADLAPWVERLYAAKMELPADHCLTCGIFSDAAFVRIQLAGEWTAYTADGPMSLSPGAFYFGPNTRRMPISVRGSFISLGVSFRPGGCTALKGPRVSEYLDRAVPIDAWGYSSERVLPGYAADDDPESWLRQLEDGVRSRIAVMEAGTPDPIAARFEDMAFTNPSISINEFARACGVDKRTVERIIRRDFGLSPKQVLRRSRALDMASHLRGVADEEEAEALMLRYYDQSHLIHEFTELFGMSPGQFVTTPQPLLTLVLEARQARRLEAITRITPGAIRPWE